MSWITEVLILASSGDNNAERLGEVNAFFGPDGRGFADVERSAGGNKVWYSLFLAGAFNHLELDALLEHLRTARSSTNNSFCAPLTSRRRRPKRHSPK